jgi:protein-S-isoprenylcysteine O-methyltransferase Ste14
LLNKANDIVGQILLVIFFGLMGAVPLGVLILGVINFIRAVTRKGTIVLQVLAAMAVWFVLSYVIVMIFIVVVFSFQYPLSDDDNLKSTAIVMLGTVIYAAVGAALIYWTKRQAKLSATIGR